MTLTARAVVASSDCGAMTTVDRHLGLGRLGSSPRRTTQPKRLPNWVTTEGLCLRDRVQEEVVTAGETALVEKVEE